MPLNCQINRFIIWWNSIGVLLALVATGHGASPPTRQSLEFIHQLQRRELHRLAEVYCRQQLSTDARPEQAPLVLELMNSLAGRAMAQRDLNDTSSWAEIEAIGDQFHQRWEPSLAATEVDLRRQWLRLARAQWLLAAADLDSQPQRRREQAGELLRRTSDELKDLAQATAQLQRATEPPSDPEFSRLRQRMLQQIEFVRGQVMLSHADCYPAESADQVHLLTQALQAFTSLARITPPTEVSWESRLREIECQRRLGNTDIAEQRLQQFPIDDVEPRLLRQRTIEQAKLYIKQHAARAAAELLRSQIPLPTPDEDKAGWAEALLTLTEAYVALAQEQPSPSKATDESRRWQALALEVVRQLEQHASVYWVRRAEAILAIAPDKAIGSADLEIIGRTAANFYRQQQFADAQSAYQRAAQLAQQLELDDQAFHFGLKAAAIMHQRREHPEAVAVFEQLAQRYPKHLQAPQAHWMAIANAAEWVRQDSKAAATYQRLLRDHLQNWPTSPWTDDVRYWYGRLCVSQGQIDQAIELWRGVHADSTRFEQVLPGLRDLYQQRLQQLAVEPAKRAALATQAVRQFADWRAAAQVLPDDRSALAWDAALSAAEFGLLYGVLSGSDASDLIRPMGTIDDCARQLPDRARAWHGLVSAVSGDATSALQLWNQVNWNQYALVLPLSERLLRALVEAPADSPLATELARLQGELTKTLRTTDRWQNNPQLLRWRAEGMAHVGQITEAIEIYRQLSAQSPRDLELQQSLAEMCERNPTAVAREQALDCWRQVARLAPANSERWFRAKLGIAQNLVELGQYDRAAESVRILQALHPDLGGPELKSQFQTLMRQMETPESR